MSAAVKGGYIHELAEVLGASEPALRLILSVLLGMYASFVKLITSQICEFNFVIVLLNPTKRFEISLIQFVLRLSYLLNKVEKKVV